MIKSHTAAINQYFSELQPQTLAELKLIGVGTDLCAIARMDKKYARWGHRFGARVLSQQEFEHWRVAGFNSSFLAKRWAGKEAVVKALGLGFSKGLRWQEIELLNTANGKPFVRFLGQTHQLLVQNQNVECYISLADEQQHAFGFAIVFQKIV